MRTLITIVLLAALGVGATWLLSRDDAAEPTVNDEIVETPAPDTEELLNGDDEKSGITFKYPEEFDFTYVSASEWPPRFVNALDPINCELSEQAKAMSGATWRTEVVNGIEYCIWETSEGAAGSVYRTYQIIYPQDGQYFTMSFTLRYPQCANYSEAEVAACQSEQARFPLHPTIEAIAQSAHLPV